LDENDADREREKELNDPCYAVPDGQCPGRLNGKAADGERHRQCRVVRESTAEEVVKNDEDRPDNRKDEQFNTSLVFLLPFHILGMGI
jgi:hypothetical protein